MEISPQIYTRWSLILAAFVAINVLTGHDERLNAQVPVLLFPNRYYNLRPAIQPEVNLDTSNASAFLYVFAYTYRCGFVIRNLKRIVHHGTHSDTVVKWSNSQNFI